MKAPKKDRLGDPIDERVRNLITLNSTLPQQRTPGWFEMRKNRMTASAIASVLKLTQMEIDLRDNGEVDMDTKRKVGHVMPAFNNLAATLRKKVGLEKGFQGSIHTEWGVTYEPIVTELYELANDCVVHEFGLIPHPTLDWLGASPDGITSDGRMLEIKCPYSRKPKGMPKMQYWVQMQIQMACCGLDVCDFVDVVINEYYTRQEYLADQYIDDDGKIVFCRNAQGWAKGIVLERITYEDECDESGHRKQKHEYYYPPLMQWQTEEDEQAWLNKWCQQHFLDLDKLDGKRMADILFREDEEHYRIRYWHVSEWHCREVKRRDDWLEARLPEIHDFWKLVLKCRETGEVPEKYHKKTRSTTLSETQQQIVLEPTDSSAPTARLTKSFSSSIDQNGCLFVEDDDDY